MSASLRNGALRHRVTVQAMTEEEDDFGQMVQSFTTLASRWASIDPVSGTETVAGGKIREGTTHKVRLRWATGLNARCRIVFGTRTFEVLEVLNFREQKAFADLLCREVL